MIGVVLRSSRSTDRKNRVTRSMFRRSTSRVPTLSRAARGNLLEAKAVSAYAKPALKIANTIPATSVATLRFTWAPLINGLSIGVPTMLEAGSPAIWQARR